LFNVVQENFLKRKLQGQEEFLILNFLFAAGFKIENSELRIPLVSSVAEKPLKADS
jgi:hypothetical protein